MKIEFERGEVGYHEARNLRALARCLLRDLDQSKHDIALIAYVERAADEYMARPQFRQLREQEREEEESSFASKVRSIWGTWMGPSGRELELCKQRIEALGRAMRAEHASFEALVETVELGRERDEARARVKALEDKIDELQALLDKLQK